MGKTGKALLLCAVILMASTQLMAEQATVGEMDLVSQNWLTRVVAIKGNWAGGASPSISDAIDILESNQLLAKIYRVEPKGYVIVPVIKELPPVKMYSDEEYLTPEKEAALIEFVTDNLSEKYEVYRHYFGSLDNPQAALTKGAFGGSNKEAWAAYTLPPKEFKANMTALKGDTKDAGPLLTSHWDQREPYNDYCPMGDGGRVVVGCVATAAAQILYYWQWPPSGFGDHTYTWSGDQSCGGSTPSEDLYADFSDPYDWANMVDSCGTGCTPEQSAALAELNYETGVAFNMNYGACGSGASVLTALVAFPNYFRYKYDINQVNRSDYSIVGWYNTLADEIDAGRPIQYRINKHSIVCDGYRYFDSQFQYHMNYGWTNGDFNAWYVLDSLYCSWLPDSLCPADEEYAIVNIEPLNEPVLYVEGQSLDDSSGDGDNHADPGETVNLGLTLYNLGYDAVNTVGTITSPDTFITVNTGSASYDPLIETQTSGASLTDYTITIDPSCPDPHLAPIIVTINSGTYLTIDTALIFIGDSTGFTDDVESGVGYWTTRKETYTFGNEWHIDDFHSHTYNHSWKAGGIGIEDYSNATDGALLTPPFLLPVNGQLKFFHWIDAEQNDDSVAWDGGMVYIVTPDGQKEQLTPIEGYTHEFIDNDQSAIPFGTPCFSGSFNWREVNVDLSAYSGVAQIMFRFATDAAVTEEGWYIDDVSVFSGGGCCVGIRGNVDNDSEDKINIVDLTALVEYLFGGSEEPACPEEANIDGDIEEKINIVDLTFLATYLFDEGEDPPSCP